MMDVCKSIEEHRKHGFIKVGEKIRDIREIHDFDLAWSTGLLCPDQSEYRKHRCL